MRKNEKELINNAAEQAYWSPDTAAAMLDCGRATANKIAIAAGAKMKVGTRVFIDADKVRKYLSKQTANV